MYILFHQTIAQSRRNGARGGRTFARNLRLRQLLDSPAPLPAPQPEPVAETAHQASLLLDRQFPWLTDAFARKPKRH